MRRKYSAKIAHLLRDERLTGEGWTGQRAEDPVALEKQR